MKTMAAVAFEAAKPLEIVEVDLDGPRAGEVLVELKLQESVIQMHSLFLVMTRRAHFLRYLVMRGLG